MKYVLSIYNLIDSVAGSLHLISGDAFFFIYSEAFTVVTLSLSVHIDSSILSVHFIAHLPHRRIYLSGVRKDYQEFGGVLKVSGRAHLVYK